MNKGLRNEIERRKFRKRIEQVGLKMEDVHKPQNNLWAYKSTGKPCSCFMCSGLKYNRAKEKSEAMKWFESPNASGYWDM